MADNLSKLAHDIDNLVNGFLSKAQMGAQPMETPGDIDARAATNAVKGAINLILHDNKDAGLAKWNEMLDKLSDKDYQRALTCQRVDVDLTAEWNGKTYVVTMTADPAPPMPSSVITYLQPFLTGLAGKAAIKANAVRRKYKNAGSVGDWEYGKYLCFRDC